MSAFWVRTRYPAGDILGEGWVFPTREEAEKHSQWLKEWALNNGVRMRVLPITEEVS